jgi:uncharacterized protein (TIGR03435 family)
MRITRKIGGAAGLALALAAWGAQAQFEVASIKPGDPNLGGYSMRSFPGRVELRNYTVKACIEMAYSVDDNQLAGGPKGFDTEGYDIIAKLPEGGKGEQIPQMLQALLADRFKLTFHRETRSLPAYLLMPAKGGPKMPRATETISTSWGPRRIRGKGIGMAALVDMLTKLLEHPVFDETGLEGKYDVTLDFAPVQASPTPANEDLGPSIFAAIQEQLGLKLEATKRPVEVFVIDHMEKPSEN